MTRPSVILLISLLMLTASTNSAAHWTLNNDFSQLSFVTIKSGNVGEVHKFKQLEGQLSNDGRLTVTIHLASVDTLIPIRDERMQKLLFATDFFPVATFTADIDRTVLDGLSINTSTRLEINGTLSIRDHRINIAPKMVVTRFAKGSVLVNTLEPIIVNAKAVGLAGGVEKLREIAGLTSISDAVPVSFVLTFND